MSPAALAAPLAASAAALPAAQAPGPSLSAAPLGAAFAGNFQAAWYFSIICLFGLVITAWGIYQVARTFRAMWGEGDILLFAACVSLVALVVLFFGAMVVWALVALGPPVGSGS